MKNVSPRIESLLTLLKERGLSDRSNEWFRKEDLPDIAAQYPDQSVIVRRALAIQAMLEAMTTENISEYTHSFTIDDGDLFAGVLPMGSNGLGKIFPNYLTEEEKRIGTTTNKSEMALLGHNSINYERLLKYGLADIINQAKEKLNPTKLRGVEIAYDKEDFYKAVIISCEAVIAYSHRLADMLESKAVLTDGPRKKELEHLAETCRTVPENPASNFDEAIHSIWMCHLCLHASMNYMSLGRLDQVLQPYYRKEEHENSVELIQNFVIKAAYRLNLTTDYLVEQDHMDYNAALGVNAYYLDQRAGLNNFLQNIIIGGKKPNGEDATNDCTYLMLDAFKGVNLSTPGLYVRLHENSPKQLVEKVAECIHETKNLPYILNDEVMIPAMYSALCQNETDEAKLKVYQQKANDYCVDGCWEPILNGESDWTFGMINGLTILECTLNRGAALNPNPELLRGQKLSNDTGEIRSYDDLQNALKSQIQFFVDQSALSMYRYYLMNEFVVPSPLVSAFFDACLESGRDLSWAGADYNIGGTILGGVPDMVNTIAAVKKWAFDEEKYSVSQICNALKYNFSSEDYQTQELFDQIKVDFHSNTPTFGNDKSLEPILKMILDYFYDSVLKSKELGDKVFLDPKGDKDPKIVALRAIAGYYGESMRSIFPNFDLKFTAGMGTFEQYNWQGAGNAASASRNAGEPLAPNFSPVSGTMNSGVGNLLNSFKNIELERFAGGVITDICLDESHNSAPIVEGVLNQFINDKGGMLTISLGNKEEFQEIYELAKATAQMSDRRAASEMLGKYAHIVVRVGGWNAPFITLPLVHMENYVKRIF
jgi:formate C-acetyltransferase